MKPIFESDQRTIEVHCWSDSQVVLQWLTKSSDKLKTYVANRVANEINLKWSWIAGEDNPADIISRGTTLEDLHKQEKWWRGPKWLSLTENWWPNQQEFTAPSEEVMDLAVKEIKLVHLVARGYTNEMVRGKWFKFKTHNQSSFPLLKAYGDWGKLLRVTTTIFNATHKFGKQRNKQLGTTATNTTTLAEQYLIRLDQASTFAKEIEAAKEGHREQLARLVLIWDTQENFLRVDGRIHSDNVTRDEQFPILLDKSGSLASLLIRDAQVQNGHAGTQWILQYLGKILDNGGQAPGQGNYPKVSYLLQIENAKIGPING